jgi:hypothetical protein
MRITARVRALGDSPLHAFELIVYPSSLFQTTLPPSTDLRQKRIPSRETSQDTLYLSSLPEMKRLHSPDPLATSLHTKRLKPGPTFPSDPHPKSKPCTSTIIVTGKEELPRPILRDLGRRGRFSVWTPDHVILESLEGRKFSISKLALCESR